MSAKRRSAVSRRPTASRTRVPATRSRSAPISGRATSSTGRWHRSPQPTRTGTSGTVARRRMGPRRVAYPLISASDGSGLVQTAGSGTSEETVRGDETSNELLGELARELSVLLRSDLEVGAAEHGPQLRHVAIEIAAALAAAVALLLALATASSAAVQGLSLAMPTWGAGLIVAAVWAAVAALLLSLDHPRRLLVRLR